ncbi:kinase-like domain-containing protein [Hygrophoropsis aurantiaca]|uniref:Kinase-like domain-containing protein n=1 Tax=Hygrophoropsis aurantiaca TaxID=72124 RepID=A0ACB8A0Z6_9AGAM|nr:kinase-like domain-containing protein [Hygrophoropsis aurantiaca]
MPIIQPERLHFFYVDLPLCEQANLYRKGGYHPVHIDDILNERYRVVNKLGYGSYATVWLVKDLTSGRYAALKILTAEATNTSEVDVLRHLKTIQAESPDILGGEFIVKVFDDFTVDGPNGTHQCFVTEVLGPHLATELDLFWGGDEDSVEIADALYPADMKDDQYPIDTAKKMVAQVAQGVAYLHRIGVVHGDLHPKNALLYFPEIENWSDQDIQKYFGPPKKRRVIRHPKYSDITIDDPRVPEYFVLADTSVDLLALCTLASVHIKICDFGQAFLWGNEPTRIEIHTPRVYAAPEVIFRDPVTPAADIWALAVLAHYLLSGGSFLFHSYSGIEKEVVRSMVLTLGKLPDRWWSKWDDRTEWFDDSGTLIGDAKMGGKRMLVKISCPRMEEEEIEDFEDLIRRMVCYQPEDRISADDVVQSIPADWIKGCKP